MTDLTEKDLEWTADIDNSEAMFSWDSIPLNWNIENCCVCEREYFINPGLGISLQCIYDGKIQIDIAGVTIRDMFYMHIDGLITARIDVIHLLYNGYIDICEDNMIIRYPSYLRKLDDYVLHSPTFWGKKIKVTRVPDWIADITTKDVCFESCLGNTYKNMHVLKRYSKAYMYVLNTCDANCILDTFTCTTYSKSNTILQTIDAIDYVIAENHPLEEIHCYTIDLHRLYVDMHALTDVDRIHITIDVTKLPSSALYIYMVESEE